MNQIILKNIHRDIVIIKKVLRTDNIFKNRSFKAYDFTTRVVFNTAIPDNLVICDSCNKTIKTQQVFLWNSYALCENCFKRYTSNNLNLKDQEILKLEGF